MFATFSLMADTGSKKLNEDIGTKIMDFIQSEMLNFGYYCRIRNTMTVDLLNDEIKKLEGRDLIIHATRLCLMNLINLNEDLNTDKIAQGFKPEDIIDTIFKFIEETQKNIGIQIFEEYIRAHQLIYPVKSGYTYDDAMQILHNKELNEESLASFIKIFLLSDDYFNVDVLLEMRERILSSKYLENIHKYFGKLEENNGIMVMFFADYKFMIPFLDGQLEGCYDYNNFSNNFDFIIALMYGAFLINISSFIYSNRIQFKFNEKNGK